MTQYSATIPYNSSPRLKQPLLLLIKYTKEEDITTFHKKLVAGPINPMFGSNIIKKV